MHPDTFGTRYLPTSPLSPRMSTVQGSLSLHSLRGRATQPKPLPRSFQLDLPPHSGAASPTSAIYSPAITLNRGTQPTPMESPRLMREKQKELIARAQLTSKLAASPMTIKPDAPRLDPLGSPKGAVTPLALEEQEAADYFTVATGGRFSPAASPSARSSRSSTASGKEEKLEKMKKKKHNSELFQ